MKLPKRKTWIVLGTIALVAWTMVKLRPAGGDCGCDDHRGA